MPRLALAVSGCLANLSVMQHGGVEGCIHCIGGEGGPEQAGPRGPTVSAAQGGPGGDGSVRQRVRLL